MKIKRFEAEDMRSALRRVQEELGADAVILSTESRAGGVCMIAALDYDEALISPVQEQIPPATPAAKMPPDGDAGRLAQIEDDLAQLRGLLLSGAPKPQLPATGPASPADRDASILRRIGLDPGLCQTLAKPEDGAAPLRDSQLLGQLSQRLNTHCDALRDAPALALVGPTGSGKTTTAAKIAARFLMRGDAGRVRFICTDDYRIGAREQLQTFARLLGASVRTTGDMQEVSALIRGRQNNELIIVDTPGIGPHDENLAPQLGQLGEMAELEVLMCLPAPTHPVDLRGILRRYSRAQPKGLILTKVDETCRLGMALSAAIEAARPIAWITDGQRVPQDIHALSASDLVARAVAQTQALDPMGGPVDGEGSPEARRACA